MNGGAVAYLTHSQYGRNGNEITINNNSNYITGIAGDSVTASESSSITNAYNTTAGMKASTSGNIYGVYDMNGGAFEYTANWDTLSSSPWLTNNGKAVDGTEYFSTGGSSDRTKTAYSNDSDDYDGEKVKTVCRSGDGIKETWISGASSWFQDWSNFLYSSVPFSLRGGNYYNEDAAGVFCSGSLHGGANADVSFRAVLACAW